MKLEYPFAILLALGASGCDLTMTQHLQAIHPEYRERAQTEAVPVGQVTTIHCVMLDIVPNPRAREIQLGVHMPVVEAQIAKLDAPVVPVSKLTESRICRSLTDVIMTAGYKEVEPQVLRNLHPGGDQNVLYVWSYLSSKPRDVVDSRGYYVKTVYDETEVAEYNAYLIDPNGHLIYNAVWRCGVAGEDYYGRSVVDACDAEAVVSVLLDAAPIEMPADVAESFLAKQARQEAENAARKAK